MAMQFKRISCDGKVFWNMPVIGIGTFRMKGQECQYAVESALKIGYRHIDTAECYHNHCDIGKAIKSIHSNNQQKHDESKENMNNDGNNNAFLSRKDMFITSKLSPRSMKSENKVESAINKCLKSLETEYIDLFLIHWPGVASLKINDSKLPEYRKMAWKIMEKYVNKGMIRCVGVSNFEIEHLKPFIDDYNNGNLQYKPALNQFEFHPLYQRYDIIDYCNKNDIQIAAYGSLGAAESFNVENIKNGKHPLLHNEIIMKLSQKYDKTAAQILIRYGIEHNFIVIPKSTKKQHIEENFNVFDFEIDIDDIKLIDSISHNNDLQQKFAWDPSKIN